MKLDHLATRGDGLRALGGGRAGDEQWLKRSARPASGLDRFHDSLSVALIIICFREGEARLWNGRITHITLRHRERQHAQHPGRAHRLWEANSCLQPFVLLGGRRSSSQWVSASCWAVACWPPRLRGRRFLGGVCSLKRTWTGETLRELHRAATVLSSWAGQALRGSQSLPLPCGPIRTLQLIRPKREGRVLQRQPRSLEDVSAEGREVDGGPGCKPLSPFTVTPKLCKGPRSVNYYRRPNGPSAVSGNPRKRRLRPTRAGQCGKNTAQASSCRAVPDSSPQSRACGGLPPPRSWTPCTFMSVFAAQEPQSEVKMIVCDAAA
ncbi:PREDICTED: uncharacterized protein LOC102027051 [Chinchilla lanigera]|uniref:uncharacterized protein LOC102027051 n=1 Tax=Chinchilla lanigera TaxID=34839 RepID=UPI000696C759|nr:PREDICTED: uncharacterized protein LOC102027051 [Chinchilla lanigera]